MAQNITMCQLVYVARSPSDKFSERPAMARRGPRLPPGRAGTGEQLGNPQLLFRTRGVDTAGGPKKMRDTGPMFYPSGRTYHAKPIDSIVLICMQWFVPMATCNSSCVITFKTNCSMHC